MQHLGNSAPAPPADGGRPERHLILGGGGFIGRQVGLLLARAGHQVTLANRRGPTGAFPPDAAPQITWTRFDLATLTWDALLEGVDAVHHYAWSSIPASANADPAGDLSCNVAATLRLLEAARIRPVPPRIVFSSSGGTVYGRVQQVPVPESHPLAPITAYGAGKAAVELYMGCYRALHGLDCRVARLSNPFGVGQDVSSGQGAATAFLRMALNNQRIEIWGTGDVVRDYIHISDAAAGLKLLAMAPRSDGPWVFNLASGHGVSLNEIVTELEAQLHRRLDVVRTPGRAFDVPISVLDVTLAREALGWAPLLSFSEGVARTIEELRHPSMLHEGGLWRRRVG